jgi:hypothetical protein
MPSRDWLDAPQSQRMPLRCQLAVCLHRLTAVDYVAAAASKSILDCCARPAQPPRRTWRRCLRRTATCRRCTWSWTGGPRLRVPQRSRGLGGSAQQPTHCAGQDLRTHGSQSQPSRLLGVTAACMFTLLLRPAGRGGGTAVFLQLAIKRENPPTLSGLCCRTSKKSKGFALVQFADPQDAVKAHAGERRRWGRSLSWAALEAVSCANQTRCGGSRRLPPSTPRCALSLPVHVPSLHWMFCCSSRCRIGC